MRAGAALLAWACLIGACEAGAWTLDRGHIAIHTGTVSSRAGRRYDAQGGTATAIAFHKLSIETGVEYGLTDAVTLFALPQYIMADADSGGASVEHVNSVSLEAGARILLLTRIGMLAVQLSGKSAGAFDMSVSASGAAGRQAEARLLYGRNFSVLGHRGYLDVEAARRWVARPRPDEIALDISAGLWLDDEYVALAQSFNLWSGDGAVAPYRPYRLHKLQLSLVQQVTPHWSLQSGWFTALAGRSIVREQGFVATIWYRS